MNYVKRAEAEAEPEDRRIRESVENMIADIRVNGETAVRSYAEKFDGWVGDFVLSDEKKVDLIAQVLSLIHI